MLLPVDLEFGCHCVSPHSPNVRKVVSHDPDRHRDDFARKFREESGSTPDLKVDSAPGLSSPCSPCSKKES